MSPTWSTDIPPVRVFGLTLREPLTIAHVMLLAEADSPLVLGGVPSHGDIALAAFVCAYPAHVSKRRLASRMAGVAFRLWSRWIDTERGKDEAEAFAEWFKLQCDMPPKWRSEGGRVMGTPWWLSRVSIAMAELGMSYHDATTLPCKLVGQLVTAIMEARGLVELETEEQTAFIRWAMAQAKEAA